MLQFSLFRLPSRRVQPTNLLPTRVVITSNNPHRRLLLTDSFGSPNRSLLGYERSLRSYPINPRFVRVGLGFSFFAFFPWLPLLFLSVTKPHRSQSIPAPLACSSTNSSTASLSD